MLENASSRPGVPSISAHYCTTGAARVVGVVVTGKSEDATDSPPAGEEEPKALKSDVTRRSRVFVHTVQV